MIDNFKSLSYEEMLSVNGGGTAGGCVKNDFVIEIIKRLFKDIFRL